MNYGDNNTCASCNNRTDYADMGNLTTYECDNYCSCRNSYARSNKDIMEYNFYVLNKPLMQSVSDAYKPKENVCKKGK